MLQIHLFLERMLAKKTRVACVECSFARCCVLLLFWHWVLFRIWLLGDAVFFQLLQLSELNDPYGHKCGRMRYVCRISTLIHCYASTRCLFQVACAALVDGNVIPSSAVFSKKKEFCKASDFLDECERSRQNTDFASYLITC